MAGEAAYLERAVARYSPEVSAIAKAALAKLRKLFPGARILVYDRRLNTPIGFAPASGRGALFSIVIYPRWVRFFFLEGVGLIDPEHRLEGTGNQVRSLKLDAAAAVLDDPYILALIALSLKESGVDLKTGRSRIELKSTVDLS